MRSKWEEQSMSPASTKWRGQRHSVVSGKPRGQQHTPPNKNNMDVDFEGCWACPVLWTCNTLPMALPSLNLGEPAALSSVRGSFQMIKMIGRKRGLPLLQLLALLLLLSCLVHPLGAVPAHIGSLSFGTKDTPVLEDTDQVTSRDMRMMEEEISKMEIASNDYPGSGANNRHDPKSPGRV